MAVDYTVQPAGAGLGQGLAGLGSVIQQTREREEERVAMEEQRKRKADAQAALYDAWQTKDPEQMMAAAMEFPELGEMATQGMGMLQDFQKQEASEFAMQVLANPERAGEIAERRIQLLNMQGRDPKDTLDWYQSYMQDPKSAITEMELMLPLINPDLAESYLASKKPLPDGNRVVGDYLVDASGNVLFDASKGEAGGTPEYGLTPLIFRNPTTGEYQPYLPNKAGGMTPLSIPEGQEFVPDAARMGFNPTNIQERVSGEANAALTAAPVVGEAARQQALAETVGQRAGAVATKESQFKLLDDVINEVKDQSSNWTTGFIGSGMRKIPGTDAADMAANLDTLLAAAGFEKLQEMRNNSPTGGALGSVTERELALLQATWGSIQQPQSKEQFDKNLERFQKQVKESWERVDQAYQRDYGSPYFQSTSTGNRLRFNPATGDFE
jgi:hypothetical protein